MALHERSMVELRPDGSIVITSHHRPQLPNEILSLILNHVRWSPRFYECALVSKQFYAIANPLLWNTLNFYDEINPGRFFDSITDSSPQRLATLVQHLRELWLDGPEWTDAQLTCLLPDIPQLQRLHIMEYALITDTSLQHLPYHCQQLTYIHIDKADITQVSFSAIGQYCHQLTSFEWNLLENQSLEWLVGNAYVLSFGLPEY